MKYIKLFERISDDDITDMNSHYFNQNKVNDMEKQILDEFEGHEKFYNFLALNDCLYKWVNNMKGEYKNIKENLDRWKKNNFSFYDYINKGFDWDEVDESFFYWRDISKKGRNKKEN